MLGLLLCVERLNLAASKNASDKKSNRKRKREVDFGAAGRVPYSIRTWARHGLECGLILVSFATP